jgi:hypothetical protein
MEPAVRIEVTTFSLRVGPHGGKLTFQALLQLQQVPERTE